MADITLMQVLEVAVPAGVIALIGLAYRAPFDAMKSGIDGLKDTIGEVRDSVRTLATKLDALDEKVDGHNGRVVALETWRQVAQPELDSMSKAIAQLSREIESIRPRRK